MSMQTMTRLYGSHQDTTTVMRSLEAAGVPHADISLVSSNASGRYGTATTDTGATATGMTSGDPQQGAGTGACRRGLPRRCRVCRHRRHGADRDHRGWQPPVDMATRRAEYTAEGWERFNPDAIVPYRAGDKTMAQGQEGVTIP